MKKILILFLSFFVFINSSYTTEITASGNSPCDNNTLNKYTGTANIEINWEPNTINLNWYDGDTKLTVTNNAQSCVYDGNITVPPQPTKPGYTFNGWKVIRVPGGFTELEYIESTGTQWIDSGITPKNTIGLQIKFRRLYSGDQVVIGSRSGDNEESRIWINWANGTYLCFGEENYQDGFLADSVYDGNADVIARLNYMNDRQRSWGNYSGTINSTLQPAPTMPIYLFAANNRGNPNWTFVGRIYYVNITDNKDLVFNGIPARRNSDNVVGMYDSISGQFFTNAGTGTFIAGPAVQ